MSLEDCSFFLEQLTLATSTVPVVALDYNESLEDCPFFLEQLTLATSAQLTLS